MTCIRSFAALAGLLAAPLFLASCMVPLDPRALVADRTDYPPYEGTGFTDREWTEREQLLARADFSAEVVRLVDSRRQRTMAGQPDDTMLYQYDADDLLEGMTYRLPVLFNKYMSWRPRQPKHYLLEVEVVELLPRIETGTFWTGSFGRYDVTWEVRVVARRPDSRVALSKTYRFEHEEKRKSFNGRSPSVEMDRSRMYDMIEDMVRLTTERALWDIRLHDSRYWDPAKDVPPAPVQVHPAGTTAVDRANTGAMEGALPLEVGAPNEAPEAPLQLPVDAPLSNGEAQPLIPPPTDLPPRDVVSGTWVPRG